VNGIHMAEARGYWSTFVKAVVNLLVSYNAGDVFIVRANISF